LRRRLRAGKIGAIRNVSRPDENRLLLALVGSHPLGEHGEAQQRHSNDKNRQEKCQQSSPNHKNSQQRVYLRIRLYPASIVAESISRRRGQAIRTFSAPSDGGAEKPPQTGRRYTRTDFPTAGTTY